MKATSPLPAAARISLLAVVLLGTAAIAQTPQATPPSGPPPGAPPRTFPPPTNLQVLPKTLTSQQVHDIMEQWEAELGVHCNTCHTADEKNLAPNGRPRLLFADDSKPEKASARLMYRMTEELNRNYVSKIPNSGAPVTCGTCHRGHFGPEPFVAPEEKEDHPQPGKK